MAKYSVTEVQDDRSVSGNFSLVEWPTLYWSIRNLPSRRRMESPVFSFQEALFRFNLQLNISKNIGDDCYHMYLECTENDDACIQDFDACLVSVRIQNKHGVESFFSKEFVTRSVFESQTCVWSQERKHLLSRYDDLKITNDRNLEILRFRCIFGPLETSKVKELPLKGNIDCLKQLSLDFSKLRENSGTSDIVLHCGGKTFFVHKSVLLARCEKLLKGVRVGSVEIDDVEPNVLQQLVEYMYSGCLTEKSKEIIFDLYDAGSKYCFQSLTKMCTEYITESLDACNAHRALTLAHEYKDEVLKKDVLAYCTANEIDTSSGDWAMICEKTPNLACDVYLARISYVHKSG